MTDSDGYNGWKNYETWAVKLWIDNDQGEQERWIERALDCSQRAGMGEGNEYVESVADRARMMLRDELKEAFEETQAEVLHAANMNASVWADLLNAALSQVDWREIAEAIMSDAAERS